jgi:hypothetical protein
MATWWSIPLADYSAADHDHYPEDDRARKVKDHGQEYQEDKGRYADDQQDKGGTRWCALVKVLPSTLALEGTPPRVPRDFVYRRTHDDNPGSSAPMSLNNVTAVCSQVTVELSAFVDDWMTWARVQSAFLSVPVCLGLVTSVSGVRLRISGIQFRSDRADVHDGEGRQRHGWIKSKVTRIEYTCCTAKKALSDDQPVDNRLRVLGTPGSTCLLHGPQGVGKRHAIRSFGHLHGLAVVSLPLSSQQYSANDSESGDIEHDNLDFEQMFEQIRLMQAQANDGRHVIVLLEGVDRLLDTSMAKERRDALIVDLLSPLRTLLGQRAVSVAGTCDSLIAVDRNLWPWDVVLYQRPPPNRRALLTQLLGQHQLVLSSVTFNLLYDRTAGYLPADLDRLLLLHGRCRQHLLASSQSSKSLKTEDEERLMALCLQRVRPTLLHSTRVDLPSGSKTNALWEAIGGCFDVKQRLIEYVEWPVTRRSDFLRLGLRAPRGVLLHGPPGCSKTSLVRALAARTGFTFCSVDPATLLSCYVGESERLLREIFAQARLCRPSIVFVDEFDALVGSKRGASSNDAVSERVLLTFLNELDGLSSHNNDDDGYDDGDGNMNDQGLVVVAATNRVDVLDPALVRPGRFDLILEVPLPSDAERRDILRVLSLRRSMTLSDALCRYISDRTPDWSGADLANLVPFLVDCQTEGSVDEALQRLASLRLCPDNDDAFYT